MLRISAGGQGRQGRAGSAGQSRNSGHYARSTKKDREGELTGKTVVAGKSIKNREKRRETTGFIRAVP